jgi:hypothetical protein
MPDSTKTSGSADYLFQKIASGKPTNVSADSKRTDARRWFRERAAEITQVNAKRFFSKADENRMINIVGKDQIGQMFTFWYDAKHKKTLPYWDQFPLIFVIESYSDGFLGINMHYLPPAYRAKLMDALYTTSKSKKSDSDKLLISYQLLKSASKYRYFKPCVKRYLFSQVSSKFMVIRSDEWDMALCLPLERFKKVRKEIVWEESLDKIQDEEQ